MVSDQKAEALEARGLYRRAAARWADVMVMVKDDRERDQAAVRRSACIPGGYTPDSPEDGDGQAGRQQFQTLHGKEDMTRS